MEDVKLPDLEMIREYRGATLPPQSSLEDTSNWDDKAFNAPTTEREFAFIMDGGDDEMLFLTPFNTGDSLHNPYIEQERLKAKQK